MDTGGLPEQPGDQGGATPSYTTDIDDPGFAVSAAHAARHNGRKILIVEVTRTRDSADSGDRLHTADGNDGASTLPVRWRTAEAIRRRSMITGAEPCGCPECER